MFSALHTRVVDSLSFTVFFDRVKFKNGSTHKKNKPLQIRNIVKSIYHDSLINIVYSYIIINTDIHTVYVLLSVTHFVEA